MPGAGPATAGKRPPVTLTVGSKVRVRSSGGDDEPIVSTGTYLGLVSIGGDNSLALRLDDPAGSSDGPTRLIPLGAMLALDLLEVAQPEEEKRVDAGNPGYFA
jgi:hypothetical protein